MLDNKKLEQIYSALVNISIISDNFHRKLISADECLNSIHERAEEVLKDGLLYREIE
jgi:hypothetical protein